MIKDGVEDRGTSLRLIFSWQGKQRKEPFTFNGEPVAATRANKEAAARKVRDIKRDIEAGVFVWTNYFDRNDGSAPNSPLTFGQQLDSWLDAQRHEHSTMASYRSAVKFWKEAEVGRFKLGDKPLVSVLHSDIKKALAARADLKGKTINNYALAGRQAFEQALSDGIVSKSPFAGLKRAKQQSEPPDPFTKDEAERILAHMAQHYPAAIVNYTEFKFFTGVRTSESFGLHWRNVDLASSYMLVTEGIVRGIEKKTTKTNVARNVMLNSRAMGAIQRQRQHTQMKGEHVFVDPRYGTPWYEERAYRRSYWEPTLRVLGIRHRPPYNTRHTYATMMLMAGRTPGWCAKQLGHSLEMFFRTYAKWIDGDQDGREIAGMEQWLGATERAGSDSDD